jgi:hypothetical protein
MGRYEEDADEEGKDDELERSHMSAAVLAEGTQGHGQAVVKDSGSRVGRFSTEEEAAVRIQAKYRGYTTRRTFRATRDGTLDRSQAALTASELDASRADRDAALLMTGSTGGNEGSLALLDAEDALGRCLKATHGLSSLPDLRPSFSAIDREGRGQVNRKQFAHAVRQHGALMSLSPLHIKAFMDHFDSSTDGTAIDYRAFLVFAGPCLRIKATVEWWLPTPSLSSA